MTTGHGSAVQGPVAIPELHHGDIIHIAKHEVFRHTKFIHTVACAEADVEVDRLLRVETIIVICWRGCASSSSCGAVVYDADDSVPVIVSAA